MIKTSLRQTCQYGRTIPIFLLITVQTLFSTTQSPAADPASSSRQESVAGGAGAVNTPDVKSVANSTKVIRYAQNRISKYDMNRDGMLQADEWKAMKGNPEQIDADKDRVITPEELAMWIAAYQGRRSKPKSSPDPVAVQPNSPDTQTGPAVKPESLPLSTPDSAAADDDSPLTSQPKRQRDQKFYVSPKRLPEGLPDWFLARDKDGDGQLTEAEFSTTGSSQELAEFKGFDANGDGVVTAKECSGKTREKKSGSATKPTSDGLPSANPDATPKNRRKTKAAK